MTIHLLYIGAGFATLFGFYYDIVRNDRASAAYHLAWLGVFLACIALRGG